MQNNYRRFEADSTRSTFPTAPYLTFGLTERKCSFASLDQGDALVLTGTRAPNVTKGTRVPISVHNGPTILSRLTEEIEGDDGAWTVRIKHRPGELPC